MLQFAGLNKAEIEKVCIEKGFPKFLASQLRDWVYKKGVSDPQKMTNLSKKTRDEVGATFSFATIELVKKVDSSDEETTKYLWRLKDGKLVESVLIRSFDRRTVCVSSQVGCPAKCAFCASGKEGLLRNLSAAEIHEQVLWIHAELAQKDERVSHIVFMGMGEPLRNYDEVTKAISLLSNADFLGISQRRITVSTVGVVEGILALAKEPFKVNLVLSLHAPNQKLRQKIIPYARQYELSTILEAMQLYAQETKRDITYEYTLLAGINDSEENAKELVKLLKGQQCSVNLIPYNPVSGLKLKRPERETIEAFRMILDKADIVNTCRYTKGDDIAAACGQLALQKESPMKIIEEPSSC